MRVGLKDVGKPVKKILLRLDVFYIHMLIISSFRSFALYVQVKVCVGGGGCRLKLEASSPCLRVLFFCKQPEGLLQPSSRLLRPPSDLRVQTPGLGSEVGLRELQPLKRVQSHRLHGPSCQGTVRSD